MSNITTFNNELFGTIRTVIIDEEIYFVGKDVAEALGYKDINRAVKQHTDADERKELKRSDCKVYGDSSLALWSNENDFSNKVLINESGLYSLIFGSELSEAKAFKKWVTSEILPTIRQAGCYIGENATTESIDFQTKFGARRIRKTFMEAEPAQMVSLYEEYMERSKQERKAGRMTNKDRVRDCEIIKDVCFKKVTIVKPMYVSVLQSLAFQAQKDITELNNRKNGGEKSALTKQNNLLITENNNLRQQNQEWQEYSQELESYSRELEQQVEELMPPERTFVTIDFHAYSTNYMYQYTNTGVRKSPSYIRWQNNFPYDEIPTKEEYEQYEGVNFNKPIEMEIHFVCMDRFDTDNLSKSLQDTLFNNYFGVDDNIVVNSLRYKDGSCNSYDEGKIRFAIYNIDIDSDDEDLDKDE